MKIELLNDFPFKSNAVKNKLTPRFFAPPFMVISSKEFLKSSFDDISYALEMFCSPNCFEPSFDDDFYTEIRNFLLYGKGTKVVFGINTESENSQRHLYCGILKANNKYINDIFYFNLELNGYVCLQRTYSDVKFAF